MDLLGWAIAVGGGLVASWLALAILVWVRAPGRETAVVAAALLPDTVRLLRAVARDPAVGRAVRARLRLLVLYLLFPIDLIPDVLPVIGYADDVVLVAIALRSIVRRAGPEAIRRHWPGSAEGLAALWRLARLPGEP